MAETPIYRPPDVTLLGDDHVRVYQQTDGREGYLWNGAPILLLTTTGWKTGARTKTRALIYGQDGDSYLVVASKGGSAEHPSWYRNLQAHPRVEVQVQGRRFEAEARTADEAERSRLWTIMRSVWPNYDVYETRTSRRIPVVVLQPVPQAEAGS
jgi:deazaflavin-dependent oxidoreductase (nitroreductase family)